MQYILHSPDNLQWADPHVRHSEPGCYNLHRLKINETISKSVNRHEQRSPLWIIGAQGQTRTI